MSTASSEALNRMAIAIDRLERAVTAADHQRRKPSVITPSLRAISERIAGDAEMVDLEHIVVVLGRLTSQANSRAHALETVVREIAGDKNCQVTP